MCSTEPLPALERPPPLSAMFLVNELSEMMRVPPSLATAPPLESAWFSLKWQVFMVTLPELTIAPPFRSRPDVADAEALPCWKVIDST